MASALAACSDAEQTGPAPGVATIGFAPRTVTLPYMNLTRARARLERVQVIGNVPPPPPSGQPPPNHFPPPPPSSTIDLDALSAAGASTSLEDLPQGLYSRVRFLLGRISLEGRWKGTVFNISLAPFGAGVDLRASAPQELGLDRDVSFQVGVDPNLWFPPYLLDYAMLDNRGEIVCDDVSNPQIGQLLTQFMLSSFSLP